MFESSLDFFFFFELFLKLQSCEYVIFCAIWYHLDNLKNVKNTHGGVLILAKLRVERIY